MNHNAAKRRYIIVDDEGRICGFNEPGLRIVFDTRHLAERELVQVHKICASARIVPVLLVLAGDE